MFNNVILDVFIGLIFIFLLYSLLATVLMEIIAHRMNLRARMLVKAIRKMLEDHASPTGNWFQRTTFYNYFAEIGENIKRFFNPIRKQEKIIKQFYDHPSVKYLGEDKSYSKPAYLQPHNFSYTLLQLLRGKTFDGKTQSEADLVKNTLDNNTMGINEETLSHLRNLFADARQDVYLFRQRLEQWFDETMERCNGWYKRQSQLILLVVGLGIALFFNVDTIAITRLLAKDKKIRDQMVEMAISRKDQYGTIIDSIALKKQRDTVVTEKIGGKDTNITKTITYYKDTVQKSDKYFDTTYKQLQDDASLTQSILGLSINIPDSVQERYDSTITALDNAIEKAEKDKDTKQAKILKAERKAKKDAFFSTYRPYQKSSLLKFIGWLLTAWAISLGAPFWFDLLNKFIQVRTTGPRVPTGTTGATGGSAAGGTSASTTTADGKPIRG